MNILLREFRALHQAVMFFTRIPLPSLREWKKEDLQRSVAYFPLVGWMVGALAGATWYAANQYWTPFIASGLSLAVTLILTGAFHEDGFADVCDGFGGGSSKERILEIMRDSRVGAFGAIGVMVMLGLKWHAVASLPVTWIGWVLIVAAHAVSRGAAACLMRFFSYVREEIGKAKPLATELSLGRLIAILIFSAVPVMFLPTLLAAAVFASAASVLILGLWFRHRIGGYTGDCLGAAQQVAELVFYLSALGLMK